MTVRRKLIEPLGDVMKAIVVIFLSAVLNAAAAAELMISGDGNVADTKYTEKYAVKPLAPYKVSFEARKESFKTQGRTLCAGLSGRNVDLPLEEDWTAYSDIVATPSSDKPVAEMAIRFTLWKVSGNVLVRNWNVTEQQAVHATDGELTLGDGETMLGTRYTFSDMAGSCHHNHSRPLYSWRGSANLNTDRYPLGNGGEIVWKHELSGRRFLSGEISLGTRYFGKGDVRLAVSKDGVSWTHIGSVTASNRTVNIPLDAGMFPADRMFVRVKGEKTHAVQLGGYSFTGTVSGKPLYASGATVYADMGKQVSSPKFTVPEYYRSDYGELLPDTSSALALWRVGSGWRVPRDRLPPTVRSKGLELSMAANETEAAQIVLTPAEVVSNVTVDVEIPSFEAKVLKVAYVRIDQPVDYSTLPGMYPDPIPPQSAPMTLKAKENQPFWIKVKAPKGTPKGVYRGCVTVRGERTGGPRLFRKFERRIPLFVEVFGFELPDRMTCKSLFGFYPAMVDQYHGLKNRKDRLRVYDKYLQMYSEYHISASAGATYGRRAWYPKWNGDEPVFNWKDWDEGIEQGFNKYHFTAMRMSGGLGLGGGDAAHRKEPEINGVKEGDPRYEVRLAKLLKGVQDHLDEKGWLDRTYIYCFDEPPEKDNAFVMNGFAKLAKYAPKLRRFLTSPCRRDLLGGPQTWCPIAPDLESPLARERQRMGEEFWLYVCTNPRAPYATEFIDHPAVELRTWLWQSWAEKVTGILIWTANLWTSKSVYPDPERPQNPYVDAQAWNPSAAPWGNGDGRIFYPPESVFEDITCRKSKLKAGPNFDDPVGSIRGEMLRDGIEDYEYFTILKRLDPSNSLLKVPPTVSKSLSDFSKSPAGIETHRALLAREIEKLFSMKKK